MAQKLGTWVYDTKSSKGDTTKLSRLDIRDEQGRPWGTAVGLGWSPTLEVRRAGDAAIVATVAGAWEDATDAAALFSIGDETTITFEAGTTTLVPVVAAPPVPNSALRYEGQIVMIDAGGTHRGVPGADGQAEWFEFTVQRWP
jgi:hypothetical protein